MDAIPRSLTKDSASSRDCVVQELSPCLWLSCLLELRDPAVRIRGLLGVQQLAEPSKQLGGGRTPAGAAQRQKKEKCSLGKKRLFSSLV